MRPNENTTDITTTEWLVEHATNGKKYYQEETPEPMARMFLYDDR